MSILFFYPMAALVFFSFLYGLSMFFVRVASIRKGETDPRYFKLFNTGTASELVLKMGQHFTNLFEVPVIFYAGCITYLVLGVYSAAGLVFAWVFFVSRLIHAYIHTTHNRLYPRVAAFFTGVFSLLLMWIFLLLKVLQ